MGKMRVDATTESGDSSSEKEEEGSTKIKWDICPELTRREKRAWKKMLQKHRKVFSGPEGRLGKVDSKFDMRIEANAKEIKSQRPYRTSPRKRQYINEAVQKLTDFDVIQPSSSDVASPVVVVV